MEVIDINTLLSYKSHNDVQNLDDETNKLWNSLFGNINRKKSIKKGNNHILKNQKLQNKKDNIENKINLILNKLSESNIDNLLIEFLENINQINEDEYIELQQTFYTKIVTEINFIKIYLQFLRILSHIYNKVQKYNLSEFIGLVEKKFKTDYLGNIDLTSNEQRRINNLQLIKSLVESKILSEKVLIECDKIMLNQTNYYTDIYYWFIMRERELSINEINKIKDILKLNISSREKVLLDNLINKKDKEITIINVKDIKINNNTLQLEVDNIIDEYLLLKSLDEIRHFIESRCTDAITKNKFSECLIDKYFIESKDGSNEIIELMKLLTKNQILFKSNLSRGLLLIYGNWKDKVIDYQKGNDKMKNLLLVLKGMGITKGIEHILENYSIS